MPRRVLAEMFYRKVKQAVLLFGLNIWVLLAEIEITVEDTHIGFLRKITEK